MHRTINLATTPAPVRPADALTLKFNLEEALAFRTAIGTLDVLYDALASDTGHVREDESYALDAARITALFQLLDGAFTVLHAHGIRLSDGIDAYRAQVAR